MERSNYPSNRSTKWGLCLLWNQDKGFGFGQMRAWAVCVADLVCGCGWFFVSLCGGRHGNQIGVGAGRGLSTGDSNLVWDFRKIEVCFFLLVGLGGWGARVLPVPASISRLPPPPHTTPAPTHTHTYTADRKPRHTHTPPNQNPQSQIHSKGAPNLGFLM